MLDFSGMSVEQYEEHFKNQIVPIVEKLYLICMKSDGASETTTLNVELHGEEDEEILALDLTSEKKAFIRVLIEATREGSPYVQNYFPGAVWFITQILARVEVVHETRKSLFQFIERHKYFEEFNMLWTQWWNSRIQEYTKH